MSEHGYGHAMNQREFQESQKTLACKFCGEFALELEKGSIHHPGGGIWCQSCKKHNFWLSKDRAENYRPKLPRGTLPQVWEVWGSHCAHCGLSEEKLSFLGIGRTVQHVPPFKERGNTEYLIPLCDWCQQDSASKMKRLETLVDCLRSSVWTANDYNAR